MRVESDRIRTIALYRGDLVQRLRTGKLTCNELAELHGRPKVCWCAPRGCHGDVLAGDLAGHYAVAKTAARSATPCLDVWGRTAVCHGDSGPR